MWQITTRKDCETWVKTSNLWILCFYGLASNPIFMLSWSAKCCTQMIAKKSSSVVELTLQCAEHRMFFALILALYYKKMWRNEPILVLSCSVWCSGSSFIKSDFQCSQGLVQMNWGSKEECHCPSTVWGAKNFWPRWYTKKVLYTLSKFALKN